MVRMVRPFSSVVRTDWIGTGVLVSPVQGLLGPAASNSMPASSSPPHLLQPLMNTLPLWRRRRNALPLARLCGLFYGLFLGFLGIGCLQRQGPEATLTAQDNLIGMDKGDHQGPDPISHMHRDRTAIRALNYGPRLPPAQDRRQPQRVYSLGLLIWRRARGVRVLRIMVLGSGRQRSQDRRGDDRNRILQRRRRERRSGHGEQVGRRDPLLRGV